MRKPFVNLHTHSYYSILNAVAAPKDILKKAISLEYPAVALTDTGVGYGLVDFYEQSQKIGKIKPILGAEIFVTQDSRFEQRAGIDGKEGYLLLIVKDHTGYENLLHIISKAHLEGFYYKPRADWELLSKHYEGLIALTGATGGIVGRDLRDKSPQHAEELLEKIITTFGKENTYLELVSRQFSEQIDLNKWKVEQAQKRELPLVVTSDARYLEPEYEEACDTLMCIGKNQDVNDPHRIRFAEKNWFKSYEEIEQELHYIPGELLEEARKNTLKVADSITLKLDFGKSLLPQFEVPYGETEASQLRKDCEAGIKKRFGKTNEQIEERLDYELSIVAKMGFDAYFLIVADFINFARSNDIAVGPGRGSAAGSLVAYLLEITNVDPLKYELLFERFLNPERISMPDIDIDFSDERRDEVLQYVTERYGADKVSKVCTFGTLAAKAALKDVGRAQGIPFTQMNTMTKVLPNRPGFTLADAEKVTDFQELLKQNEALQKVFNVAKKLEGCVRHVSVHACAVMIAPDDLSCYSPLQWTPGAEKVKITQFPYQQLEHLGLLKMDFLGLKNLTILEKAIANINYKKEVHIELEKIPIDDEKTFEMMARGETTGVFQFESAGMRRYLRELKPTEFEDLVAMNALYRPGPMEYIPQYIEGKHDPEKVKYMHEVLEPILRKTYGIAVYQEQVLKIAQVFAGFSLGEADILRKAIGKKIASILAEQRKRFIEGATEKGYPQKLAIKIFDEIIVPFSGYGFNRSHAVCYARIAYETAYLRANYPVEFMAAMMTTDRNKTDRIVLEMNECAAMAIEILPPAINESGSYFTVISHQVNEDQMEMGGEENQEFQEKNQESRIKNQGGKKLEARSQESGKLKNEEMKAPLIKGVGGFDPKTIGTKQIRFGLSAIKGLGEETVDKIILERKNGGYFSSLMDFAKRVPAKLMNKKTLEALAFSGAFDEFGDRKAVVDSLDDLSRYAKEQQEKSEAGQMGLFGGIDEEAISFALKDSKATKDDILKWERESMGLFVSDHPLKGLKGYFEKYGTLIGHLSEVDDVGTKKTLHGIVTSVRNIVTKRGKRMAILEIEDTSGKIEGAVFPQIYDKIPTAALQQDAFIRTKGKVEERDGILNFIVDEVIMGDLQKVQKQLERGGITWNSESKKSSVVFSASDSAAPEQAKPLRLVIPEGFAKEKVEALKELLRNYKSNSEESIKVIVVIDGNEVKIPFEVVYSEGLDRGIDELGLAS